ncbi:MAG: phosphotransferase [Lachnospiraceae bacterium]|nr:phosphotransferase [Lachnospiraceae bacterium]
MNDRAVSILEQYELEVLRTWKGRGAILCETNLGTCILKEYSGRKEKAVSQDAILKNLKAAGIGQVEQIILNKEGDPVTFKEQDGIFYMVKTYFTGNECNIWDVEDCKKAAGLLGRIHGQIVNKELELPVFHLLEEYDRHNKEIKRVKKFLKQKGQKSVFERFLLQQIDTFYEQALAVTEQLRILEKQNSEQDILSKGFICHGDYQYHNILVTEEGMAAINFERLIRDYPIRDLYLFLRKFLEKNNWSDDMGRNIIAAYQTEQPLSEQDMKQLYIRFAYPEKFWKIVNFYDNSRKVWIPEKNMEKLSRLLDQDQEKRLFLKQVFGRAPVSF